MNLDLGKRQSSFLPSLVDFFSQVFFLQGSGSRFYRCSQWSRLLHRNKGGGSFSQFLAWAAGEKPVIPLSSLESLVFGRPGSSQSHICPLLWAGREGVFSSLPPAAAGEHPKEAMPPRAYSRDELQAALFPSEDRKREVLFLSDAPEKCAGFFSGSIPVLSNLHPTGFCRCPSCGTVQREGYSAPGCHGTIFP